MAGDSAGGNLAAVVALVAPDRSAPTLTHRLLVYPITDCAFDTPSYRECGEGNLLTKGAHGVGLNRARDEDVVPEWFTIGDFDPTGPANQRGIEAAAASAIARLGPIRWVSQLSLAAWGARESDHGCRVRRLDAN